MGVVSRLGAFVGRTWAAMLIGLTAGGLYEYAMIKSHFYEHAVKSRAQQVNMEWDALDDAGKRLVWGVDERYRAIQAEAAARRSAKTAKD
jgi:predicted AlkP superfamily phosphohydrolase/phosphomutase